MTYQWNKTWRKNHPDGWNKSKQRYYAKTGGPENNHNYKERYSKYENQLILEHELTDHELHKIIGRSVKSIQVQRWKLKKILQPSENTI